jgi:hypothetical protein
MQTVEQVQGSAADRYRAILQNKIDSGARAAANVIETIHRDQPKDQIVRSSALTFSPRDGKGINVNFGGDLLSATDYALGQLATKCGAPPSYVKDLASASGEEQAWQRALAAEVLTRHYAHEAHSDRMLARSVRGELRGWVSDRFRRLDSRPLLDALAHVAQEVGAVPVDGTVTETRVAFKIILPEIIEPIPGEFLVYGGEWSNSDYGNGAHGFRAFALRVVCLNGMTRENLLRQIHIGGQLEDSIEFSDRTLRLDTAASVSKLRDVVRGALGPAGRDRMSEVLRAANEKAMSKQAVVGAVKNLSKSTAKSVVDAFESEDVINLPAGKTAWRASNAVSWVARHTEDAETRLDLERLAGSLA